MSEDGPVMLKVPACCGAKYLTKDDLKPMIVDNGYKENLQGFLNLHKLGYIFSDRNIKGFKRVCKGLYYINADKTYEPRGEVEEYGTTRFAPHNPRYGKLPYVAADFMMFNVNLLCSFPHGSYDVKENVVGNLARNGHLDSIAILNTGQVLLYEKLLLGLGFSILNRTQNLQYNIYNSPAIQDAHYLTLYHRPPTTKEAVIEAS